MNSIQTVCPRCGYCWPVGNYHECPTHVNAAAGNPWQIVVYPNTNACAAPVLTGFYTQVFV